MDKNNGQNRNDDKYIKVIADKTIRSLDSLQTVEDFDEFRKLLNENLESIIHPKIEYNDSNPNGYKNGLFNLSPLPEPPHLFFQTYDNTKQNILKNLSEFENGYFNYESDNRSSINSDKSNSSTPIPIDYNNIHEEIKTNQYPPQPHQNQYILPPQKQNQFIPPPSQQYIKSPSPPPPQQQPKQPIQQYIPSPPSSSTQQHKQQYIPSPSQQQQYIKPTSPPQPPLHQQQNQFQAPPPQHQYTPSPLLQPQQQQQQQQQQYIKPTSSPSPSFHYYPSPQNIQSYKYPPSTTSTQITPRVIYPSNRNEYEIHRNISPEPYKKEENINTHYHYYIPPCQSMKDKPLHHQHHQHPQCDYNNYHHHHHHQRSDENEYCRNRSISPSHSPSPPPPKYFSSSTKEDYIYHNHHHHHPHYESIKYNDYNIYKSYPQRCHNEYPLKSRPIQSNYLQNKYNCMKRKSNFVSPDFVLDLSCSS